MANVLNFVEQWPLLSHEAVIHPSATRPLKYKCLNKNPSQLVDDVII